MEGQSAYNYWGVVWSQTTNGHSVTEPVSSGSPLINNNRKVIGQLWGGKADCSNKNSTEKYGRFDISWTGDNHSDIRRRLNHWLDPANKIPSGGGSWNGISYYEANVTIPDQTITGTAYFSATNLTAEALIIESRAVVTLEAKESIRLKPGFHAKSGSEVRMYINPSLQARQREILQAAPTFINTLEEEPKEEILGQNHPNPFNDVTKITCIVPDEATNASIRIYNTFGQVVKTIPVNAKGENEIYLNSREFTAGLYHYSLIINNEIIDTKRMIVSN